MRIAAIMWCTEIAGLQVYLFRRVSADLVKNHMEGTSGFRTLLAGWVECGFVKIVEDEVRFWNGSKIYLCHCEHEKNRFKYQGAEIHVLLIDEITHFTEKIYRFLRNRVRLANLPLPDKYKDNFPKIICGGNPGHIGHLWVKATWIDRLPPLDIVTQPPEEGGMMRQFIPAKLSDNPTMTEDDPLYEARLSGLGSKELVRAMRDGDWDVVEGAFFDCWSPKLLLKPFELPDTWQRFTSFDWGSAKPFAVLWFAVVTDDYMHEGQRIPRGALIVYREWYGAKKENGVTIPDVGLKMTVEEVAREWKTKEPENVRLRWADPAIFTADGGPSMSDRMGAIGIHQRPADNARVPRAGHAGGWDQVRDRMKGEEDCPMLYFFETCRDSIRTIPALQHDETRPEDLDTKAEDHLADTLRYGCMSRPYKRPLPNAINRDKVNRDYGSVKRKVSSNSWRTK